ncbi:MAG: NusG domain II-containing protein [Rectinemataceae bacterium]|jgi:hypothetical protein
MRLKPLDIVIAIAAVGVIAFTAVVAYGPGGGQASAVLTGKGGEWVYPLSVDRVIRVAGPLGDTIVEIQNGAIRIKDSPCPNKTCIAAGSIERTGQWLACLPNQVMVRIEGRRADAGVDASAY